MRVIAGSAKGCKLKAPAGLHTRPTADHIKETIFNILAAELWDALVLDLFSGTGAMAIEALSRGAEHAVLVEKDKHCIDLIEENLKAARLMEKAVIMKADVSHVLAQLGKAGRQFDLIFLDPPYRQGLVQTALQGILHNHLLKDSGIIMAEQGGDEEAVVIEPLEAYKMKEFKTIKLVFYKWRGCNDCDLSR